MKILLLVIAFLLITTSGFCAVKYIDGYSRRDGTYVTGHYRDTSNDGVRENNANYLGLNGRRPEGIY